MDAAENLKLWLRRLMAGKIGGAYRLALAARVLLALAIGVWAVASAGCGRRADIHPALQLNDDEVARAQERGKHLIAARASPYEAYRRGTRDVNLRISANVILRSAGCCWPEDEVAFHVAQGGDSSDEGVRRATQEALESAERELNFVVTVQLPKDRDPASIEFTLRTNRGVEYPALVVETPRYLRDAESYYRSDAPPSAVYQYVVKFPVRGGPGIPAIGPQVGTLYLVVCDGEMEATAEFCMPRETVMR